MTHIPVLLKEVIQFLDPKPGNKFIDATIGMGGHAKVLLDSGAKVLGIDRDFSVIASPPSVILIPPSVIQNSPSVILNGVKNLDSSSPRQGGTPQNDRLVLVHGNFADLKEIARENGFTNVDGILFDLGIGSHQLDDPERGFSFQNDGPLGMRFNAPVIARTPPSAGDEAILLKREIAARPSAARNDSLTAGVIVNLYSEKDLVRIFHQYGEEHRFGKKIARAIVEARKTAQINTTTQLFDLIKKSLPAKFRFKAGDTARRIFQALRIEVNKELESLEKALPQALELLKKGGKLAVISFHSLEDRIVKRFYITEAKDCVCPPEIPVCVCGGNNAKLKILTRKPVVANPDEIEANSRARSAKLRVAIKI